MGVELCLVVKRARLFPSRLKRLLGTQRPNMDVNDKLELLPSAKVVGDLKVGTLIIGEGAVFKGNCEMRQPAE